MVSWSRAVRGGRQTYAVVIQLLQRVKHNELGGTASRFFTQVVVLAVVAFLHHDNHTTTHAATVNRAAGTLGKVAPSYQINIVVVVSVGIHTGLGAKLALVVLLVQVCIQLCERTQRHDTVALRHAQYTLTHLCGCSNVICKTGKQGGHRVCLWSEL